MLEKEEDQGLLPSWWAYFEKVQGHNQRAVSSFLDGAQSHFPVPPTLIGDTLMKAGKALLENPNTVFKAQTDLLEEMNKVWQKALSSDEKSQAELSTDKRFRHDSWQTVPYFSYLKDSYLLTSRWLENLVSQMEGLDEDEEKRVQFYTKQMVDALSPANFPFTNPEVLEEMVRTQGRSFKKGVEAFLKDIETGKWMKMTDPSAFTLGENIASTKGDVIFRNDLFELIHYQPLTKKQYAVPLLIIPPWINKFYIFDLSPENSFVRWMLEQGHNVFIMSWVNPDAAHASKRFDDYLLEGAYRACEVVSNTSKSPTLHAMGYCVGGDLLTALSAYLEKTPAPFSLQSMTLLATIIDFSKIGALKIVMDENHIQCLENTMAKKGFLEAETLKSMFSMLRPNDLVWSFFVKNYLLGQVPQAFDFLYWNSDATRLPATLHSFIIRKCFQQNLLMQPKGIKVKGVPLDLREIKTPTYMVSTLEDHISPWKSSYPASQLFKGPLEFVLAGSGHVAGIMNPPSKNKYGFFTNPLFSSDPEDWLQTAKPHEGSWWTSWNDWVKVMSGERSIPKVSYPSLGPAPGTYVTE